MNELRRAIEPLGEKRVVAVDEDEDVALSLRPQRELSVQRLNERLVAVEIVRVAHDEIGVRIAGRRRRQFDLARHMVRRDRDRDLGVVEGASPFAVEERAGPVVALARRRDEERVIGRAGRARGDGIRKPVSGRDAQAARATARTNEGQDRKPPPDGDRRGSRPRPPNGCALDSSPPPRDPGRIPSKVPQTPSVKANVLRKREAGVKRGIPERNARRPHGVEGPPNFLASFCKFLLVFSKFSQTFLWWF